MSAPRDVAVVVPAFNAAATVGAVVSAVRAHARWVVVVDDGSRDASAALARRAGAHVLCHPLNRGQGAALMTGITYALALEPRAVVTFDADGQHRAEDLPQLVQPVLDGACEIALGSRFLGAAAEVPRGRRWLLRVAVGYTRATTGLALTDTHNGLRCFSAPVAARLKLRHDRMAHATELLTWIAREGVSWREVPVTVSYSRESLARGQSGLGALRILYDLVIGRFW